MQHFQQFKKLKQNSTGFAFKCKAKDLRRKVRLLFTVFQLERVYGNREDKN
jgi:hypothetical protein